MYSYRIHSVRKIACTFSDYVYAKHAHDLTVSVKDTIADTQYCGIYLFRRRGAYDNGRKHVKQCTKKRFRLLNVQHIYIYTHDNVVLFDVPHDNI